MQNEPDLEKFSEVFVTSFKPFSGFTRKDLEKVPLISQRYYSTILLCLSEIESIRGINIAFSPIVFYVFIVIELIVLITVYFVPLIIIAFWAILLGMFFILHKRRKSFFKISRKGKQIAEKITEELFGIYLLRFEVVSKSFIGWTQDANIKLFLRKGVTDGLKSLPSEGIVLLNAPISVPSQEEKFFQVDKAMLKEYNSTSDLSAAKGVTVTPSAKNLSFQLSSSKKEKNSIVFTSTVKKMHSIVEPSSAPNRILPETSDTLKDVCIPGDHIASLNLAKNEN